MSSRITSPQEFFGFQMGEDRKIARWDSIIDYFNKLDAESDRIQVINMGPSTEGNPFLLTIISSADNLANLEKIKGISAKLADPRQLAENEVKQLVKEGKAVILQSMSLHASEIGGTQMAPELAYDLLSNDSEDVKCILDNVVFLMVPCFNPDGQLMVADWYEKWLGTEYEGCSMPWLYHKYSGHDNNRDAFMLNLVESQYMAKLLFREWYPQAYQDHHHMGSYGARYYVAPYSDPIRPFADPLVWRELSWYGAHMAYKLEEEGKQGILNGAQFPAWGHYGFHWITNHHNIAGMLTESASANLATPKYIHSDQLTGSNDKTFPEYAAQTNFPNPWPGGWWRLRDIVEQQKISAMALLELAAKNKETVLWNSYQKAKRQTERGDQGEVKFYVISSLQHDPLTARKLAQLLLNQGVEVQLAKEDFVVDGCTYPKGSYVVSLAQPKMGVIVNLLGKTLFPDTYWTSKLDGTSMAFDSATDTVGEYMGVSVVPIENEIDAQFTVITELADTEIKLQQSEHGYVFDGRLNDSYAVANHLLKQGQEVWRLKDAVSVGDISMPVGAFYTLADLEDIKPLAEELGVSFYSLGASYEGCKEELKPKRIGLYQRYWGGNADEGWTRLVFEKFGFSYTTIMDKDIRSGSLIDKVDILVLPSDFKQLVIDITAEDKNHPQAARLLQWFGDTVPPEYKSGMGEAGVLALKEFLRAGGRLVAMNHAVDILIDALELKVKNVVAGLPSDKYLTHGSTLWAEVNNQHPLGYGMPNEAMVFNWDSPVLHVTDRFRAERYEVVVSYPEEDILQSGQLNGESIIRGKAAMIATKWEEGDVVLIAAPPQHRAQTHGTFKLLFNCLW